MMDSWNDYLKDWKDLNEEKKTEIYINNSGFWSNRIVDILKNLFDANIFEDAIIFITKFYEIESNLEYFDELINTNYKCKGIVDFACEIQKNFLEHKEILKELCDRIQSMNFHPFIKFLYSNQDFNNNMMKNESCIELLYSSMQGLTSMAKDLKAQEEFGKLYSNQWHFFFELLQNAVDADAEEVLVKRKVIEDEWCFLFANKGKKFSPMDVWGIASIKQGMKSSKNIGFFGIGFKSIQEICDSPIIMSTPFQFRLNLGQRKREDYVEWNLSEVYSESFSLEQLRYNNYFILDQIKMKEYSGFEDKVIEMIDPLFMMFLTPLKEINFSFEGLEDKILKVKRRSYDKDFEIISIDNNKEQFITKRYTKKFSIEDKEFERQVQIAFKIIKKSKKISVEQKNSNLFSYFPLDNRNPGFNFIFHGQFSLTNSRQDINTANSLQKTLNYKLFEELGPECFLELFKFLSNSKKVVLDENLERLIPFEEKEIVNMNDPAYLDIVIYNSFRSGLVNLLKKPNNHNIPLWYDQKQDYIPFSNIIFTDNSSENYEYEIVSFLKAHFNSQFKIEIARILQYSSYNLNLDYEIYISNDQFKTDFCKQVFDEEFDDRLLTSEKILDLIIAILRLFDSRINVDYILRSDWENYYFNSEKKLEDFQNLLSNWYYFEEVDTKTRLFEHYLLTLKDCEGKKYYAKVNFSNYFNIEAGFNKAYPEVIKLIRQLKIWSEKNSEIDLDLPLFIPEEYRKIDSKFYSNDNYYSIFKLNELLFANFDEEVINLVFEDEKIYKIYFRIIEKVIKRLEQRSSLHENRFKIEDLKNEYKYITQDEIEEDSDQIEESVIIRSVLNDLLELYIYRRISSKELLPFSDLIWGNEQYLQLLSESPFVDSYYTLDYNLYRNIVNIGEFLNNIVKLMNLHSNKDFFEKYSGKWFSSESITIALEILVSEYSHLILYKKPEDLVTELDSFDNENQIVEILFKFLSMREIFIKFFEAYYNSLTLSPEKIIFLSDLTEPSLYQFFDNNDNATSLELFEKLETDLFISIGELCDSLHEEKVNIVFKTDSEILKKIGLRDISDRNSISELLISMLEKLDLSEDYDNWFNFYDILENYFNSLRSKEKIKFKKDIRLNLKEFKVLNEEYQLVNPNQIYDNENFLESFKEHSYAIRNLIELPYFQSNKIHSEYNEIWDFLQKSKLIHIPFGIMKKFFIKKLLESKFQESISESNFYSFLSDNFSKEEENYIDLYKKLLNLINSVKLTLKNIRGFYLIPTMTMELIQVSEIKQNYNILNKFNLKDFPLEKILEEYEDFSLQYFDEWLEPLYFNTFTQTFKKAISKKEKYNGKHFDEVIRKEFLPDDFELEEYNPIFLHLYLIDYYFRIIDFNYEEHRELIYDSLKIFERNNISSFITQLNQNDISEEDIQNIFKQAISGRRIFPVYQEDIETFYLTELYSEEITILSRKIEYPRFFVELSEEHKVITFLDEEIEKTIEKMPKSFNLSYSSFKFPMEKILDNFQDYFSLDNEENLVESNHKQLIQYIFNNQNYNYYLKNDKENLDEFLSSIKLKTLSDVSIEISEIYHPDIVEKILEGLNDLIGSNFNRNNLSSKNMLDMDYYDLKENFLKISLGKNIFKEELNREEAYEIMYNYFNNNLQDSENYREILKQIGENLERFDDKLEFPEEKQLDILEDSIKQIVRFFINKIRENKEIEFNKFFIDTDQEIYKDLLSEDLIITIEHRDIDLLDNFAEYIEKEEDSKYNFFADLMPFKKIEDYSFDILINKIHETESKRIITALDILINEYSDSLETQKETEEFRKIKDEIPWIQINGEDYCLKKLFLRNSELDISSTELGKLMKEYAFFDDFDIEDQSLENFIEFFDIREILDEDLIDHLEDLSSLTRNVRTNIRDLLIFLIEKEILENKIDRIKKFNFIEVVELGDNNTKKVLSLETLLGTYTFFSNKKLIIDNLVNEWVKTSEFQDNDVYLLFDKEFTWDSDWEIILEKILNALDIEKLYGIDEFPIPDTIEESDMILVDNPYEEQTKNLSAILEYLKINTKGGFPSLNLKEARLNFLEKSIKFYEITDPRGDISIKTINGYDFPINNVFLNKLFKMEESDDDINVYISTDHRLSDKKKLYFRELYDKIFINERNPKKSSTDFNEIVEWVWMDSKDLTNCDNDPDKIKEYLLDMNVSLRWISEKKKDKKKKVIPSESSEILVQEQEESQERIPERTKIEQITERQELIEDIDAPEETMPSKASTMKKVDDIDKTTLEMISSEIEDKIMDGSDQDKKIAGTSIVNLGGTFRDPGFSPKEESLEDEDFDPECDPNDASVTEIQIEDLESKELDDMVGAYSDDLIEDRIITEDSNELQSEMEENHFEPSTDYGSRRNEFTFELEPIKTPIKEIEIVPGIKNHDTPRIRKATSYRPSSRTRNPPRNTIDIGRWGEEYAFYCLKNKKLKEYKIDEKSLFEIDQGYVIKVKGEEVFRAVWVNQHKEVKEGYDIYYRENGETFYIEVKATTSQTKNWFDITSHEWFYFTQKKDHYHLYRVYNAGKTTAKYLHIRNPYKMWKEDKIDVVPYQIHL